MPLLPEDEVEAIGARLAERRERPIKLLDAIERSQGHVLGDELRSWVRLFERYEMEVADPAGAELVAPSSCPTFRQLRDARGPSALADFVGFFTASHVIVQQDAMSYLASARPTESGRSKVYYFHPDDWGLWPTEGSILARLYKVLQEEERERYAEDASIEAKVLLLERSTRAETLAAEVDPARLFARSHWLVQALIGVGRDLSKDIERAPAIDEWEKERAIVDRYPHLAAYWLWAHHLVGNREELDDLLERTAGIDSSVFADARELVVGLEDAAPSAGARAAVLAVAPIHVLSAGARDRAKRRAENGATSPFEAELRAATDPRSKEIVRLVDHLARGGAHDPKPTSDVPFDVVGAMDRLASLVDARHRAFIVERLARAAMFEDVHVNASFGLVLAASAAASDLADFEAILERVGTKTFGPRRMAEVYRAYARFPDRRATEILALGFRSWMAELEDWIRMTPSEPVLRLLERDVLEAHEAIAQILERASFSSANWDVAVHAARAAAELRSARARKGLERAVEMKLGRIEDGTRAMVARAYYAVAGDAARALLEAQVEKAIAVARISDRDEARALERHAACLLSGLLPAAAGDPLVIAEAERLLLSLGEGPGDRDEGGTLGAVEAIADGAALGEVRALTRTIAAVMEHVRRRRSKRGAIALDRLGRALSRLEE